MTRTYLLVLFAIVVQRTCADQFPDYIQRCKVSDPKFDECVLNSANKAIFTILRGDEKYGLPKVLPSKFDPMAFDVTENVNFKFTDLTSTMNEDFAFTMIHFDFEKKTATFSCKVSQVQWYGSYEATGKILEKPFHEKGKGNITFDDLELNSTVTLGFKTKDEKKYLEAISSETTTFSKNFQFKPYNQVTVGEPMTDEQKKEYQPYFQKVGLSIRENTKKLSDKFILKEMNAVFQLLPFEDIFLP